MSTVATKIRVGAAASVFAAATAIGAAPVAQADEPASSALGGSLGSALAECDPLSSDCEVAAPSGIASLDGGNPLVQNSLIWFGKGNPDPPPTWLWAEWNIYNSVWPPLQPLFSWLLDFDLEACVLGATMRVGPYGALGVGLTQGCD